MHVLWETDRWLQKHCVSNTSELSANAIEKEDSAETTDNKAVSVTGGGVAEVEEPENEGYSLRRSLLW